MQNRGNRQGSGRTAILATPQVAEKNKFYPLLWSGAQDYISLSLPHESGPGCRSLTRFKENGDSMVFAFACHF